MRYSLVQILHLGAVLFDHHAWLPSPLETLEHLLAHPAEPADDVVIPQIRNGSLHSAPPHGFHDLALEQEPDHRSYGISHSHDACHKQQHRELLPRVRQRLDLAEADRRDGNYGHIQAVPDRPAFDQRIADRTAGQQAGQTQESDEESDEGGHGV